MEIFREYPSAAENGLNFDLLKFTHEWRPESTAIRERRRSALKTRECRLS